MVSGFIKIETKKPLTTPNCKDHPKKKPLTIYN